MFIALLRDRHAHHFVSRALLISAEPTVTDGLLDRGEAGEVADLKGPRQRSDRTHAWHCPQPPKPFLQQWISFQRTDQGVIKLLRPADHLPAQLQQRPYALVHVFVGCHQLREVAYLVQSLLARRSRSTVRIQMLRWLL